MNENFKNGFEKTADRVGATIVGALGVPIGTGGSASFATDGKGWRTAAGQAVGAIAGLHLAELLPLSSMKGRVASTVGLMGGGALGAYLAHGEDTVKKTKKKKRNTRS